MRLGAIDIGTNSMRLLIADYVDGKFYNRQKFVNTTRIGQDVDKEGYISKDAISRNIDALKEFVDKSKQENCEYIYAIGTSALRDSKNKEEFLTLAKEEANIEVEIIDGKEEANLGFLGVLHGLEEVDNILVIDIGGGSTEFIVGNKEGIIFSKSENVGALRMTEKFLKSDPIDEIEFQNMEKFIQNNIEDTINNIKNNTVSKLVGIGGTITTLCAMNQELEVYDMDKIHNSKIYIKELENILQKIKKMTINDKRRLKGLQPKRADIITAGVGILEKIMKNMEFDKIIVSEFDNLEGLICQKVKNMS
jgi:exopolyphosphatase / guanosine-5'-triphosphate,3'-diphosphate pyrophosphatase